MLRYGAMAEAREDKRRVPVATGAIAAIGVVVFAAAVGSGVSLLSPTVADLVPYGFANVDAMAGAWPGQSHAAWWRLFTTLFVHQGALHLALDVAALAFFGTLLERREGSAFLAMTWLLGGLAGTLTSIAVWSLLMGPLLPAPASAPTLAVAMACAFVDRRREIAGACAVVMLAHVVAGSAGVLDLAAPVGATAVGVVVGRAALRSSMARNIALVATALTTVLMGLVVIMRIAGDPDVLAKKLEHRALAIAHDHPVEGAALLLEEVQLLERAPSSGASVRVLLRPSHIESLYSMRARWLGEAGRWNEVVTNATLWIASRKDDPSMQGWTSRCQAKAALGDFVGANDDCSHVIAAHATVDAFEERARVAEAARLYDNVIADTTAALALDPRSTEALRMRIIANQQRGNDQATLTDANAYVTLLRTADATPNMRVNGFLTLASSALFASRWDVALTACNSARDMMPNDASVFGWRTMVYEGLGDYPKAEADAVTMITLAPTNVRSWVRYARALRLAGKHVDATNAAERALQIAPSDARALAERAWARASLGLFAAALVDAKAASAALAPPAPTAGMGPESGREVDALARREISGLAQYLQNDPTAAATWTRAMKDAPWTAAWLSKWAARKPLRDDQFVLVHHNPEENE